ncbi:hypothetical protein MTR67_002316 [Solanum verrucosum]|uniref:Uncharacterized protein n=1 Tax=Solanum verrucosum TaxID=315347 RepID=A0AAF0T8B0_SOLVR|nr:hypothetical protein MTR67_002316 [Solanum verrucosum]
MEEERDSSKNKAWHSYISEDLPRTVQASTDSAIRSARSIQNTSSTHLRTLQDFIPKIKGQCRTYEEVFFRKIKASFCCTFSKTSEPRWFIDAEKAVQGDDELFTFLCSFDELVSAREHPAIAGGIGIAAGLLLMRGSCIDIVAGSLDFAVCEGIAINDVCLALVARANIKLSSVQPKRPLRAGPRRFLYRQTLGRLQSEEAKFIKAEKNVKELGLSVGLMKKESKKLLERASLAEKDMKRGHSDLMVAGNQIQSVAKSVYKVEGQAADLMDVLREIPGREALKLRAEELLRHLCRKITYHKLIQGSSTPLKDKDDALETPRRPITRSQTKEFNDKLNGLQSLIQRFLIGEEELQPKGEELSKFGGPNSSPR